MQHIFLPNYDNFCYFLFNFEEFGGVCGVWFATIKRGLCGYCFIGVVMDFVQKKIIIFGNLYSKKNSKQVIRAGGKVKILPSDAYQNSLPDLVSQLRDPYNKDIWNCMKFDNYKFNGFVNPIHLNFKIFRKSKHKFDFINIVQGLCDVLQDEGYLIDDDANNLVPYFLSHSIDGKNPRVELSIHNTNQSINTQDYGN